MKVLTQNIELSTKGNFDIIDITNTVQESLRKTLLQEGHVTIFNPGSTAGITTIEYEDGLMQDIKNAFEKLIPMHGEYAHDAKWHDGNGHAHVRSALMKTSLTVPFSHGILLLGTWQQVIFIDFDNRPRTRKIIAQFIGL